MAFDAGRHSRRLFVGVAFLSMNLIIERPAIKPQNLQAENTADQILNLNLNLSQNPEQIPDQIMDRGKTLPSAMT